MNYLGSKVFLCSYSMDEHNREVNVDRVCHSSRIVLHSDSEVCCQNSACSGDIHSLTVCGAALTDIFPFCMRTMQMGDPAASGSIQPLREDSVRSVSGNVKLGLALPCRVGGLR